MTEKRFVMPDGDLDTDVTLIDTLTGKEYEDNFNDIVDLLNELNDENKLHKERISLLSSLLDLADAIIDTSDNEKAKQVWNNKNEQSKKNGRRF